jgi:long-chain acyl-CoA synthetase
MTPLPDIQTDRLDRIQLDRDARRLASALQAHGIGPNRVVAVLMRNDIRYFTITEACRYVGARFVVLNWHAPGPEIRAILDDSGAELIFGHSELLQAAASALPATLARVEVPTGPTESCLLGTSLEQLIAEHEPMMGSAEKLRGIFPYTSGSTGLPKGILRGFERVPGDVWDIYRDLSKTFLDLTSGDRLYVCAPLYHTAPNGIAQFAVAGGEADLLIGARFDAEHFLATIQRERITHVYLVPTMMVRLLKLPEAVRNRYDLSSLRFAVSTGAPCSRMVKDAINDWLGPILREAYGASETSFMTYIRADESRLKPGSVGRPINGTVLRILDDQLRECPVGETGTVYIHQPRFGPFTYPNAAGALPQQSVDGFVTVGDIGRLDADGYLYLSDRKKDMIISGGVNIFPAEIEAALLQLESVADCAVFGIPDDEFGESICACIQPMPGAAQDPEAVRSRLKPLLAGFKIPKRIEFHAQLPREDSGKIFKRRLRDPFWEGRNRRI